MHGGRETTKAAGHCTRSLQAKLQAARVSTRPRVNCDNLALCGLCSVHCRGKQCSMAKPHFTS